MKNHVINIFNFKLVLLQKWVYNGVKMRRDHIRHFNIQYHLHTAVCELKSHNIFRIVKMVHLLIENHRTIV
ncbi:hypothetical protein D3C85_1676210 [compost metagenome]